MPTSRLPSARRAWAWLFGKELGGRAVGGVGDVGGHRDGGGAAHQRPGMPGFAPGVPAQVAPEDHQAGGGGEAVDQQRCGPGQLGGEGGGLDRERADGFEGHDVGQCGDRQHQCGKCGDQGDADGGQWPVGAVAAVGAVGGMRWGAKQLRLLRGDCGGPEVRARGRRSGRVNGRWRVRPARARSTHPGREVAEARSSCPPPAR
jgi:hypothetical protein